MAGKEPIEVKFRLSDGSDIGPNKYDPSTSVFSLKETILSRWPQGESFIISIILLVNFHCTGQTIFFLVYYKLPYLSLF